MMNVIDAYSKFLWSFKLEIKEAAGIVQCLHCSFRMFGVPLSIQADNGKEFKNASMRSFAHELNIQIIHDRPRNPQAQGIIERVNQTIKR
ncbi:hypothetical protein ENBRE01_1729 [Enteropsectra breve]|nr:hypothetical protein ENBRE01_1729 [Enteropsectra breve]